MENKNKDNNHNSLWFIIIVVVLVPLIGSVGGMHSHICAQLENTKEHNPANLFPSNDASFVLTLGADQDSRPRTVWLCSTLTVSAAFCFHFWVYNITIPLLYSAPSSSPSTYSLLCSKFISLLGFVSSFSFQSLVLGIEHRTLTC